MNRVYRGIDAHLALLVEAAAGLRPEARMVVCSGVPITVAIVGAAMLAPFPVIVVAGVLISLGALLLTAAGRSS